MDIFYFNTESMENAGEEEWKDQDEYGDKLG